MLRLDDVEENVKKLIAYDKLTKNVKYIWEEIMSSKLLLTPGPTNIRKDI